MATDGTGTAQNRVEALRAMLVEVSEGKLKARDIDPGANLFDYGYVDSLSGVMFLARIEEQWGVQIEDVDLMRRLNTLEALAAHLNASL